MKLKMFVSLSRLKENLSVTKKFANSKIIFMVKANAYGHGMERICDATKSIVDGYGVANLEEAIDVRKIVSNKKIMLTNFFPYEVENIIENNILPLVSTEDQLVALEDCAKKRNVKIPFHLKVDTGMNRLGPKTSSQIVSFFDKYEKCENTRMEGFCTHLRSVNTSQLENFDCKIDFANNFEHDLDCHCCASNNVFANRNRFATSRIGLAGYGYGYEKLKPVMKIESVVLASKFVQKAEYIGYGDTKSDCDTNIAIVFGGYADGINRQQKVVEIDKKEFPVVCVCMDLTIVKTFNYLANQNSEVVFLSDNLNAERLAEFANTIPYDILTGLDRDRTEKIYLN